MLFDSHTHTKYSADSDMDPIAALRRAQELGLGLVFTEHFDWEFPGEEDFTFNAESYFAEYGALSREGLRLGAEIGIAGDTAAKNGDFVRRFPFDMVIGSIHLLNGRDLYYGEAYENLDKSEAYAAYLSSMAKAIREQSESFDVLGHIDYISRCAPYPDTELYYDEFGELIDEVLRAAIEGNVILEINTRRFFSALALKAVVSIYKRYSDLGGRYVTIGSDSHNLKSIGNYFAEAIDLAAFCRLVPVTFRARKKEGVRQ